MCTGHTICEAIAFAIASMGIGATFAIGIGGIMYAIKKWGN